MGTFLGYRCSVCGESYGPGEVTYTCPTDGGNLDVVQDFEAIRRSASPLSIAASEEESIWRYLPLIPVREPGHAGTALRAVGWTPLLRPAVLAKELGLQNLWVKDDGRNPTASFKDRASAVAVVRAEEIGAEVVVTASTGNAGAALAGMAAAAQVPAVILAPKTAPAAKVAQLLIFGARVLLVDGSYDQAVALALQAAEAFGWYCRNTGFNPFTIEGKKTVAFEICEQFSLAQRTESGRWIAPQAVFVSVGDGNIISGVHKGFKELVELGWIDKAPRIFGVQSQGSAAIYNAFAAGNEEIKPVQANTLADSISVDMPSDGLRALRAATQTGGAYIQVADEEILSAMRDLARKAGVFAEPAAATAYAGLVRAVATGLVQPDEQVLVLSTGSGLKDTKAAMQAAGEAKVIEPSLQAMQDVMG